MPLEVWLVRPPLTEDPSNHAWTCPKYMPLILNGSCNCGASRDSQQTTTEEKA